MQFLKNNDKCTKNRDMKLATPKPDSIIVVSNKLSYNKIFSGKFISNRNGKKLKYS